MSLKSYQYLLALPLAAALSNPVVPGSATAEPEGIHKVLDAVVAQGAGGLMVRTPQGATYQLNPNISRRHGHEPFKEGDDVTVVLDGNNYVIDMHHKGRKAEHQLVTGKLIYQGKMKNQIKLQTAEGEKVFPLAEVGIKTKGIAEGTPVTVELNEAGTVIDLHRAEPEPSKR